MVDGCIDFGLDKTQWTNTSRCHGTQITLTSELHTGLQAAWILCLCSLPQTPEPWFPNEKQNYFYLKRGLWTTEQQSSSFSPQAQVRCFWRCFCFRSGLVSLFLKTSERGDSDALTPASVHSLEVLPSVWISFARQYSQACGHPYACAHFHTNFFLPVNFAFNMLWYSTL